MTIILTITGLELEITGETNLLIPSFYHQTTLITPFFLELLKDAIIVLMTKAKKRGVILPNDWEKPSDFSE